MNVTDLSKIVNAAKCRVIGWEEASNDGHRLALAVLIQTFNTTESALLCEASVARKTNRPPDIVLIDPEIGVHVFEIKASSLDQIEAVEAGGTLRIRYASGVSKRNPISQVRTAMFDIKDATGRAFGDEVRLPFKYWVVFPFISRSAWSSRFGKDAFCANEFLFSDDLKPSNLIRRLGATERHHSTKPIALCPLEQLQCVWKAFGDTSVLYASPEARPPRRVEEGTLGELFDEIAEAHKSLSEDQQRLSELNWEGSPRLVRGVAGSGKTVVLANNLARRVERMLIAAHEGLFGAQPPPPKLLAVCFNRTLAPFIEMKIDLAFQQRTGKPVPQGMVEVCTFNRLLYRLADTGLWHYQNVSNADEIVRAMQYLGDVEQFRQRDPDRLRELAYEAIYVDEGQDFLEEEFRLLKELCRVKDGSEPNLYVFYDDAQNLYGRGRPNWQSLGLNVRGGRSHRMTQCFRNTQPIVEATFNVLYGSCAAKSGQAPTKEFGDIATLEKEGLIEQVNGFWRVHFAKREGGKPQLSFVTGIRKENEAIVSRLKWLIVEQQVRPEDIQVLTYTRQRVGELAEAVAAANIPGVSIHVPIDEKEKDQPLGQKGRVTVSTVASAKGYDAYCVLLASANEFPTDVKGRANFYVGCTRAVEHLEVFAYEKKGLAVEMEAVLGRLNT